jgi:hypothetical protein
VAIAGQVPHSEVLVATDGLSNVGLGALDTGDRKQSIRFYSQRLVSFAKQQNNTTISVIGLQGEECGLSALAPLAQQTAGDVTIVRPLELQRRMRMIIDNPVCRSFHRVFLHLIDPSLQFLSSLSRLSLSLCVCMCVKMLDCCR